mgnify:FL=1
MAILTIDIFSRVLERKVPVSAIVPIDNPMVSKPAERFKMMILLHGYNGNNMDWINNTDIVRYAEENNMVIVMPAGENKFYIDNAKTGEKYGQFIGEELVAYMRKLLPVYCQPQKTCIAGLSMGGYGAIVNGLKYPETFGYIISLSGALFMEKLMREDTGDANERRRKFDALFGTYEELCGTDADYRSLLEKIRNTEGKKVPGLYLACGTYDFWYRASEDFADYLLRSGVPYVFEKTQADHEWKFWNTYIEKGMKWFEERSSIS